MPAIWTVPTSEHRLGPRIPRVFGGARNRSGGNAEARARMAARDREPGATRIARDERGPEDLLELAQHQRDRGLRDAERARGSSQRPEAIDEVEQAQVAQAQAVERVRFPPGRGRIGARARRDATSVEGLRLLISKLSRKIRKSSLNRSCRPPTIDASTTRGW